MWPQERSEGAIFACWADYWLLRELSNLEQTAAQRYRNRVGTIVGLKFVHNVLYMEAYCCL